MHKNISKFLILIGNFSAMYRYLLSVHLFTYTGIALIKYTAGVGTGSFLIGSGTRGLKISDSDRLRINAL